VDIEAGRVTGTAGGKAVSESAALPAGPRSQFLNGGWNSLNELLANLPGVEKVAAGLPYVSGW
jgi:hypothetical protein